MAGTLGLEDVPGLIFGGGGADPDCAGTSDGGEGTNKFARGLRLGACEWVFGAIISFRGLLSVITGGQVYEMDLVSVEKVDKSWEEGSMEEAVEDKTVVVNGVSALGVLLEIGELAGAVKAEGEALDKRDVFGRDLVRLSKDLEQECRLSWKQLLWNCL